MKTISFRADMINLILTGKKTATIRPMKPQPATGNSTMDFLPFNFWERLFSESYLGADLDWRIPVRACPYGEVDDVIAVREQPDIELQIADIIATRLGGISPLIWKRDGIDHNPVSWRDIMPYCRHWNSFYGGTDYRWHKELWVWVIEFELMVDNICSMKDLIHFVNSYDSIPPKNIQGAKANRSQANNTKGDTRHEKIDI